MSYIMTKISEIYGDSATKSRTRNVILKTSLELFNNKGIDAVSMAEVAHHADVTVRTLFRYYSSKEFLVIDTLYTVLYDLVEKRALKRKYTSAKDELEVFLKEMLNPDYPVKFIMYFDIFISNIPKDHEAFKRYTEVYRPILEKRENNHLETIFNRGLEDGSLKLKRDEFSLWENYITQSTFALNMRVAIKEYENSAINKSLLDRHIEIILDYLG